MESKTTVPTTTTTTTTTTKDEEVETDTNEVKAELEPIIESQFEQDFEEKPEGDTDKDVEAPKARAAANTSQPKYQGISSEGLANIRILAGRYPSKSRRIYNHHPRNPMLLVAPAVATSSGDASSIEAGCGVGGGAASVGNVFDAGSSCSGSGNSTSKVFSPRRICNSILNSIPCTPTKVKFQFLMLGAARVGKTSLLNRMRDHCHQLDTGKYERTVGPDLFRLQCGQIEAFDIGGQEPFMRVARTYCEMVTNFLIVFDISNAESFLVARYWLDYLEQKRVQRREEWAEEGYDETDTIFVVTLVGNKKDLAAERKVSFNWAKSMAKTYDADYVEISAKDDVFLEPFLQQFEKKCLTT